MTTADVRYDVLRDALVVAGIDAPSVENRSPNTYLLPAGPAAAGSLARLRAALVRVFGVAAVAADPFDGLITHVEVALLDTDTVTQGAEYWMHPVRLVLHYSGDLVLRVTCIIVDEDEPRDDDGLRAMLTAFARARGSELVAWLPYDNDGARFYDVELAVTRRGATVGDAARLGSDAVALCQAVREGVLDAPATLDIVRAGRADVLVGQHETVWLEAKGHGGYDLSKIADAIEFSQDVARFANAEQGGLLVVGLATKHDEVGDRIVRVQPLSDRPRPERYRRIADQRVYPPVDGLVIESVGAPGGVGFLLAVYVPPQPEDLKPFLVTGAVINGKVEGAFLSIVRRRGEESIPISAAGLHQLLAAGRALLRRGVIPPE